MAEVNTNMLLLVVVGATAVLVLMKLLTRKKKIALDPERFIDFELIEKIKVSHDTRIFRFGLQTPEHVLGLPIGQHMYLRAQVDGKDVQRSYTPISADADVGHFDLMVKVYFANVHPKFPEGGKLSQHLERMKIGETIAVRGPNGRFEYTGRGTYKTKVGQNWVLKRTKSVGMLAGGTGITPMLQIIRAALKDPEDKTHFYLLFANQTEEDILLREELEKCAKDSRFHLWYTLDRPPTGWKYSAGFIDENMIREHMPAPGGSPADTIVIMCGPPPMIQFACKPNLLKNNFTEEQFFVF